MLNHYCSSLNLCDGIIFAYKMGVCSFKITADMSVLYHLAKKFLIIQNSQKDLHLSKDGSRSLRLI